jgi:hypothetical protein
MLNSLWIVLCVFPALAGCQLPIAGNPPPVANVVPIQQEMVGKCCVVEMVSSPKSSQQYEGAVTAITDDKLVLSKPTFTGRTEHRTPILGDLPWTGRLFRNVGIGRENLDRDVEISRAKIKSIKLSAADAVDAATPPPAAE